MTKTFTLDDLIRYVYEETNEIESQQIADALAKDSQLLNQYLDLVHMVKQLDEGQLEPSEKTVNAILKNAKSIDLHSINHD